eukprot:scaffold11721_cov109-Isochrysis_galbana.AAC.1
MRSAPKGAHTQSVRTKNRTTRAYRVGEHKQWAKNSAARGGALAIVPEQDRRIPHLRHGEHKACGHGVRKRDAVEQDRPHHIDHRAEAQ